MDIRWLLSGERGRKRRRYNSMDGFETYRHDGWKGLVRREWLDRVRDLDKWLEDNPGQLLVNRAGRTVSHVVVDGEDVYVKIVRTLDDGEGGRYFLKLWKWFKWRFLGGRAMKSLAVAALMRKAGLCCAETILAVRRTHLLRAEEVFISQGVPHPSVIKLILDTADVEERKSILHGVADELCDFHCHGFLHGDCIPGNLLWDGKHIHFIDNERTQLANGCLLQRGVRRNLVQFCFRLIWRTGDFTLAEYFLTCYGDAMTARGMSFYGAEDVMEKARLRFEKKRKKHE